MEPPWSLWIQLWKTLAQVMKLSDVSILPYFVFKKIQPTRPTISSIVLRTGNFYTTCENDTNTTQKNR